MVTDVRVGRTKNKHNAARTTIPIVQNGALFLTSTVTSNPDIRKIPSHSRNIIQITSSIGLVRTTDVVADTLARRHDPRGVEVPKRKGRMIPKADLSLLLILRYD